jgi:hypothetical protein
VRGPSLEECFWIEGEETGISKCEEVQISCGDISEMDKCNGQSTPQLKCFFNAEVEQNLTQKPCTNVEDINYCEELLTPLLCNNGATNLYPNLHDDGINKYPCKWDAEIHTCQNKISENEKDKNKSGTVIIIAIVVVMVVVVLLIAFVVIVILLRKAKFKYSQFNNSTNFKASEMDSVKPDVQDIVQDTKDAI